VSHLLDNLLIFGGILREAGIDVHPGRLIDVVDALGHVDLAARDEVYHVCRALLVHRHEQIRVFDRAFAAFWRLPQGHRARVSRRGGSSRISETENVLRFEEIRSSAANEDATSEPPDRGLRTWSEVAALAEKDFAAFTTDEIHAARVALARLVWNPGERRTRRWVRGRGSRIDLRRAIGESLSTAGEIVRLPRRARRIRPRPLVLLCDVSGSMERYSRMLLYFAHALTRRHQHVETFLFSTELTRITRPLRIPRTDAALAAAAQSVRDWSGGTRIGRALKELHQRWGRRVLHGSPVVLLISDGWDRGDPAELRDQIARLQRSCHRLVWLNPLIGTADYAPLTRGLQAALPFVDEFLPARTLNNLAELAIHLNALGR
jgi:uncharacterized protein with von Willebrand factor type A (vWA) domain